MDLARSAARSFVRGIVDFALPPRCPGCGTVTLEDRSFCLACWQSLHWLGEPCCARCGFPFEHDGGADAECGACLADPPHFDRLRAAAAYGEIARRVTLKLKYGGRPGVADTLAHFMQRHVRADDAILAPVPLHRWRIWRRGYNQSALIAGALAARGGGELCLDLLERTKATPPLRGLGRRERALAVRGAFHVPPAHRARIAGRRVVLVDDVFTSGATGNACARALKKAGASEVDIICWARVVASSDV
jgi:ComF family protein